MINLEGVQIESNNNLSSEILENIKNIITTPLGTVAFDRNFGIDISILDEPIELAQGKLTVDIIKQIMKYETRISVKEITFEISNSNTIIPKVRVE